MIYRMKFLTLTFRFKRWLARPANQNTHANYARTLRRYHRLMDRIDPASPQAVRDSCLLARAILGQANQGRIADDVATCLQTLILFVVIHAEAKGRSLFTVRELLRDPEAFFGTLLMIATAHDPLTIRLRLLARRLSLWPEEKRSAIAVAARRTLAFLVETGSTKP
jgi:hypothetical protein